MDIRMKGNVALICLTIAFLAVLSLFATWGTIKLPTVEASDADDSIKQMFTSMLSGLELPLTGFTGRITIAGTTVPYWLNPLFVAVGALMQLLTIYNLAAFPTVGRMIPFGLATIILVGAGTDILLNGWLMIGFVLPCLGSLTGLALAWWLDTPR